MIKLWKVDVDMPDIVCIVAANLVEEFGHMLGGALSKLEAILGVKKRASFPVDCLIDEKEPRSKRLEISESKPVMQWTHGFLEH
jgi:hypothetical protein